jgi:hypothetical protein
VIFPCRTATAEFDPKWARQEWPASYDADPTLSTSVAELFCSSLGGLYEIAGKADPAGFGRLLRESQLYAKVRPLTPVSDLGRKGLWELKPLST